MTNPSSPVRIRLDALLGLTFLAGLLVLAFVDPAATDLFPRCPIHALTGLLCSGCGTARALHSLLRGDLLTALRFNPLAVMLVPLLLYAAADWTLRWASGRRLSKWRAGARTTWGILAVIVAFTILRNLPGLRVLGNA